MLRRPRSTLTRIHSGPYDPSGSLSKDLVTLFSSASCRCVSSTISWAEIFASSGESCGAMSSLNGNAADRKKRLSGFNGSLNSWSDMKKARPVCRSALTKPIAIGKGNGDCGRVLLDWTRGKIAKQLARWRIPQVVQWRTDLNDVA